MEPIVVILKMVDGDKCPTMGYIYAALKHIEENVKEVVGYYFNLRYFYSKKLDFRPDLMEVVQEVAAKILPNEEESIAAMSQIQLYLDSSSSFGKSIAKSYIKSMHLGQWWFLYGSSTPDLRKVATKILSQTCSSSGYERNFSTFDLIHSKKQNRLGIDKLNELVYIHYNTRMQMKHAEEGYVMQSYHDSLASSSIISSPEDFYDPRDV